MFDGIRNYFYERRKGFYTFAGVAGGVYMAGTYLTERIEEIREDAVQLQKARENLRKRFQQNQEDIQYTIMTHLPTLGNGILSGMDVESVTRELQARSRPARVHTRSPDTAASESSLASSVELPVRGSSKSTPSPPSASVTSEAPGMSESLLSVPSTQTQSWVSDVRAEGSSVTGLPLTIPHAPSEVSPISPGSNIGTEVSISMIDSSIPSTSRSGSERSQSLTRQSETSEHPSSALSSKTKAELWQEVKVLAFTRTLTVIYSTTLLTLLTTIQLNIIGRSKYIQSIMQLHREEKLREYHAFQISTFAMFFPGLAEPERDFDKWLNSELKDVDLITPETERKFLTLSWWLLYVGWKDIGERVRRSVEEVFEGVSLKSRLGPLELHRLVCDVRRKVEHEITYEGTERRTNFFSTLVPPSPETLTLVFGEGGIPGYRSSSSSSKSPIQIYDRESTPRPGGPSLPPSQTQAHAQIHPQTHPHTQTPLTYPLSAAARPNPTSDPAFARLLVSLHSTIASPVFAHVLSSALDRATDVLIDGLRRNVFGGSGGSGTEPNSNANAEVGVVDKDAIEPEKPRLANLLPGLARWAHLALNTVPNELVESILGLKEVAAFAAIIYSDYEFHLRS